MTTEPTAPQHAEHAETIAAIRARAENQLSTSQRLVEALTARIGRPTTIAVVSVLIGCWIMWNALMHHAGKTTIDPPPFFWLQGAAALYGALVSTFVLTTQNREKRHGEQRAYLELQVNLLAEQKTAKIIELLEELRRDLPTVRDRVDHQADAMQQPVDTVAVLNSLQNTMEEKFEPGMHLSNEHEEK